MEVLDPEEQSATFESIGQEIDIDKIYLYANDSNESKYQIVIDICKNSNSN